MDYSTKDLELASDFQPFEGEANFPPTITKEVKGGAHIAPHCITVQDGKYILIDWREGLPRHGKAGNRTIRFPHGLMKFGESFENCAKRLISDQLGMNTKHASVAYIYSYLDEENHWHIEPIMVVEVSGEPKTQDNVEVITHEIGNTMPEYFAWHGKDPFKDLYDQYLAKFLE